ENPKTEQRDQGEGHPLPAAQDAVASPEAPAEAPNRDESQSQPEQDVERDGALQTEQMRQPIVQAVPEGRLRAEVGARITDTREDRPPQTNDRRPERAERARLSTIVRTRTQDRQA